jgi:hypothetical protein
MNTTRIAFVLDEHLLGPIWQACQGVITPAGHRLDVTRVGDPADLPHGTPDPGLLIWAERHGRILVSHDRRTMPGHLANHLAAGSRSPGVFLLRAHWSLPLVTDLLTEVTDEDKPSAWADRIEWIP